MSYIVLARKYRPQTFDEVVGQEHITGLLKHAVTSNRVAHAYLFCGPRGIGKTSCARILAKSLNCKDGPTVNPCGKCPACTEIAAGNSFDVLEIDGASNRGIDEVRTIRDNVKFAPSYGKYKIYILDEVHMLTMEAFNALLKTLEEPPEHVKFIFATTDPNKLPPTIISRCQRYDFKRINLKTSVEALEKIAKKEKFKIGEDALYAISKASEGSFRDALSIMDQVAALSDKEIKTKDVYSMLGLVEMELMFELVSMLAKKDCASALKVFDEILGQGKDIKQLSKGLVEHMRNLMVMNIGGKTLGKLLDYPVALKEKFLAQSKKMSLAQILDAIDYFIEAQSRARVTESLKITIEIAFAKMTFQEGAITVRQDMPEKKVPVRKAAHTVLKHPVAKKLADKKGQVNAASGNDDIHDKELPGEASEIAAPDTSDRPAMNIDIDTLSREWTSLTHRVSRKKMSIATYLQEGLPVAVNADKVVIAFSKEFTFYKESLESQENRTFVEKEFSDYLGSKVIVEYVTDDNVNPRHEEDEPAVKAILDTFKGKIVSRWHE